MAAVSTVKLERSEKQLEFALVLKVQVCACASLCVFQCEDD